MSIIIARLRLSYSIAANTENREQNLINYERNERKQDHFLFRTHAGVRDYFYIVFPSIGFHDKLQRFYLQYTQSDNYSILTVHY